MDSRGLWLPGGWADGDGDGQARRATVDSYGVHATKPDGLSTDDVIGPPLQPALPPALAYLPVPPPHTQTHKHKHTRARADAASPPPSWAPILSRWTACNPPPHCRFSLSRCRYVVSWNASSLSTWTHSRIGGPYLISQCCLRSVGPMVGPMGPRHPVTPCRRAHPR